MARQENANRVTVTPVARGQPGGNGTPEEVAAHLKIPEKTLAEWRSRAIGPDYMKIGRYVRYRWTDVLAWEKTRLAGHSGAA